MSTLVSLGVLMAGQTELPPLKVPPLVDENETTKTKAPINESEIGTKEGPIFDSKIITDTPAVDGTKFVPVGPSKVKAETVPPPPLATSNAGRSSSTKLAEALTKVKKGMSTGKIQTPQELKDALANLAKEQGIDLGDTSKLNGHNYSRRVLEKLDEIIDYPAQPELVSTIYQGADANEADQKFMRGAERSIAGLEAVADYHSAIEDLANTIGHEIKQDSSQTSKTRDLIDGLRSTISPTAYSDEAKIPTPISSDPRYVQGTATPDPYGELIELVDQGISQAIGTTPIAARKATAQIGKLEYEPRTAIETFTKGNNLLTDSNNAKVFKALSQAIRAYIPSVTQHYGEPQSVTPKQ